MGFILGWSSEQYGTPCSSGQLFISIEVASAPCLDLLPRQIEGSEVGTLVRDNLRRQRRHARTLNAAGFGWLKQVALER